ncbi:MAG: lyase family protein [Stackebrandtia sp.]
MRPSSSPCDDHDPFDTVFGSPAVNRACGARAWLDSMVEAEAALAETLAEAGLIPHPAAHAIAEACRGEPVGVDVFAAASAGSPVIPLVEALGAAVPEHARGWLHYGATSQDIMDTAMMLVSRSCCSMIAADLAESAACAAALAERHRDTLLIGRTLGQHAAPTSFGALTAGWLGGIDAARLELTTATASLAAQLGGPVGTLQTYGAKASPILGEFARRLGLSDPGLPWHTERTRVVKLAAALATATGVLGKLAHDVTLLSSDEIGELREGAPGSSSAMPHKRNPARSVLIAANARRAPGLASTLLSSLDSELQRPAGSWQAEWQTLSQLLRCCGGAARHAAELLPRLTVDSARMRSNLDATGGALCAGTVAERLAPLLGRAEAHRRISDLAIRTESSGDLPAAGVRGGRSPASFRDLLGADPVIAAKLSGAELDGACDPAACLPSTSGLVDSALRRHRNLRTEGPA